MVRRIFITWIQLLYHRFGSLKDKMFVQRHRHRPLPKAFQNRLLRDTRIVIDCTELYVQSSRDYQQLGNTYSSYKNHSTYKVLYSLIPGVFLVLNPATIVGNFPRVKCIKLRRIQVD